MKKIKIVRMAPWLVKLLMAALLITASLATYGAVKLHNPVLVFVLLIVFLAECIVLNIYGEIKIIEEDEDED